MIAGIRTKIRALVPDLTQKDIEPFTYQSGDAKFTLAEENILSILKVTRNGIELGTGEYSFNSDTNELEIIISLIKGDIIIVKYNYTKYSDTELNEYIRASLVFISIDSYENETDYEVEDTEIIPTPDSKTVDLIALVSAILIKPDWNEYRLPNLVVRYPRIMPKEERIKKLITRFYCGLGINDVLNF